MAQNNKRLQPKQKSDATHQSVPKTEIQARPVQSGPALPGVLQRAESDPGSLSPAEVGQLQNTIGNRAFGRLTPPAQRSKPAAGTRSSRGLTVQPKLQVGPAG